MSRFILVAVLLGLPLAARAQGRLASDFEIAQMRAQIARSPDFLSQLSARLNLGDLYLSRNEIATAREEYGRALSLAMADRIDARKASDLTRYATATAYAGLAQAKLGRSRESFEMLEESIRYTSDSAKTWNLYASAMTLLRKPAKSVAAARNAVAIATAEVEDHPSTASRLDLAIYQYSLASALIDARDVTEAERLLRAIAESLTGSAFQSVRRDVERNESFEIYSTARGEATAYLSLLNRAQLRLAALLENRGDTAGARAIYQRVVERRSDDATALAGLARLSAADERASYFAAAFDANPFSLQLIRSYQRHLAESGATTDSDSSTTGAAMRRVLESIHRGQNRAARTALDDLAREFPKNTTLQTLQRELESSATMPAFLTQPPSSAITPAAADLRRLASLAAADRLRAEQRVALDAITFVSVVTFDTATAATAGQTIFESGKIEDVPFRFAAPTAFFGTFTAGSRLRLTYRILGGTAVEGADALLVEPLGLETAQ